jgi:putative transposase
MERDRAVIEVLNDLVARKLRWGFWNLHDRLRLDGLGINHKRLHRVYCALHLNLPRRTKRRLPTRLRQPLADRIRWVNTLLSVRQPLILCSGQN